jgi:NIMA (never in mitosis gene a)-related kinase
VEAARDEAELLRTLYHPRIVAHIEHFKDGPNFYMVMEYASGGAVGQMLKPDGASKYPLKSLPVPQAMLYAFQTAEALAYLHAKGIIHRRVRVSFCDTSTKDVYPFIYRDLKPDNVLLADDGSVRVADFGVSRMLDVSSYAKTKAGTQVFMAPEVSQIQLSQVSVETMTTLMF